MLLVAGSAVLWAFIGVFARELGDLDMPAEQIGAWRALIGGVFFGVHALAARSFAASRAVRPTPRQWLALVAFMLVGVVVFYAALPLAVETGGLSLAWVLLYTAPIWVTLGALAFLGERPGVRQLLAVALAVVGVVALVGSVGGTVEVTVVSVGWGLAAGLSYSSYYLIGRRLFEGLGAVAVYALVLPAGGIVLGIISVVTSAEGLVAPTPQMLPWLVGLGVVSTYIPYLLFGWGIELVQSSRAVVVATIEPVLAIALGVVLYGETLGAVGVLGALAVLAAAVAASLPGREP